MALADGLLISSKFRGCLVGSLIGDCLGSPYEGERRPSKVVVQKYFDTLEGPAHKAPLLQYTDDTAMTKCVADSLINIGKFDAKDLAKRFVRKYFSNPRRGYGANVVEVFVKLRNSKCEDPYRPAKEQFDGAGSFGNGGAMRISPIALFFRGKNISDLSEIARKATEVTHSNVYGYNGAILQCLAIQQCLQLNPNQPLNVSYFLEELITKMQKFENGDDDFLGDGETAEPFCNKLRWACEALKREAKGCEKYVINEENVLKYLGHGVSALTSVPTAIFCFLRAQQGPIPEIHAISPFRRTVQYAISLGGDTDTIASMAGALCGAYLGYDLEVFNENLMSHCEDFEDTVVIADKLHTKSLLITH